MAENATTTEAEEQRFAGLVERGDFEAAWSALRGWPADDQARWLRAIVARWVQLRPAEIGVLAESLRAARDDELFAIAVGEWAGREPTALADYARTLPKDAFRRAALDAAVRAGTQQNPAAVATWLTQLREPEEFDRTAAYLVAHTDSLFRPTAQAREWAELIQEPSLRREALTAVVREWAACDAAAARTYVVRGGAFSEDERRGLLAAITPRPEAQ